MVRIGFQLGFIGFALAIISGCAFVRVAPQPQQAIQPQFITPIMDRSDVIRGPAQDLPPQGVLVTVNPQPRAGLVSGLENVSKERLLTVLERYGAVLTGEELFRHLSGNTLYGGMNKRDGAWIEYISPDGRAIYQDRRKRVSDGEWWISGRQICFRYDEKDEAACNYVVANGRQLQFVLNDGRAAFYVTERKSGDAENLIEAVLLQP